VRHLVLLPGLDGTGQLFDRFTRIVPSEVQTEIVPLPPDLLSYRSLTGFLAQRLDLGPESLLVAESFSGPLAVALAARMPLAGIVLCNSFIEPPAPPLLRTVIHPSLFRMAPPLWVVRRYLVGRSAPEDLVLEVRDLIASLPGELIAGRLTTILSVDAAAELQRSQCPILYLRGAQDLLVPESSGTAMTMAAPSRVRIGRVPGPHLLLQASPRMAWDHIEMFWNTLIAP
jgi:pimeloyl-ACP methyl ester carboxylesterase